MNNSFLKKTGSLLKLLGLALGLALPRIAISEELIQKQADVVIVGGGLAGLSAALNLTEKGRSVIVLEASDRVGGRTWTKKLPYSGWVDLGGQWISPDMKNILALADDLGIKTFPSYKQGKDVFIFNRKRAAYHQDNNTEKFPLPEEDLIEYRSMLKNLDELSSSVPLEAPWRAPLAKEWDSQTVDAWMQNNLSTSGAKFLLRGFLLNHFASEPYEVSFLHLLFYIHAGGGFHKLNTTATSLRFMEGSQQISEKIANKLGGKVIFNMPVTEIDQTGKMVVVGTPNGRFEAKQVIVAMAPPLAARISYKPLLAPNRDQFTQHAPMGSTIKVHAVYLKAFWREKEMSGRIISDDGSIFLTVDNSPPNGEPGILTGFIQGQEARVWAGRSDAELKKMVLNTFVKFYGPDAANPMRFYKADWANEPWARGSFASVLPPGVWTGFTDAMYKPAGRIHWAGAETAVRWYSYMEGAVTSGIRAAEEVMNELNADLNSRENNPSFLFMPFNI